MATDKTGWTADFIKPTELHEEFHVDIKKDGELVQRIDGVTEDLARARASYFVGALSDSLKSRNSG